MLFHQFGDQSIKMSLWSKLSLILWIGLGLALLSFFTFTIFILALVVGIVVFALSFFRRKPITVAYNPNKNSNPFVRQNYRPKNIKDNDIIDI